MVKIFISRDKTQRRINLKGSTERRISPEDLAAGLAGVAASLSTSQTEAPVAYLMSRQDLMARMESSGGRPKLAGTESRPKIPVEGADWARLQTLAKGLRAEKVNVTTAQVAAALLHWVLSGLGIGCVPVHLVQYIDVDIHTERGLPPRVLQESVQCM